MLRGCNYKISEKWHRHFVSGKDGTSDTPT